MKKSSVTYSANLVVSRLQAIATPLVPNMEKVQIIPPPKDVDPRLLVWKGAAVLGKMDGVSDLWVTASDWVCVNYPLPSDLFSLVFMSYLIIELTTSLLVVSVDAYLNGN